MNVVFKSWDGIACILKADVLISITLFWLLPAIDLYKLVLFKRSGKVGMKLAVTLLELLCRWKGKSLYTSRVVFKLRGAEERLS